MKVWLGGFFKPQLLPLPLNQPPCPFQLELTVTSLFKLVYSDFPYLTLSLLKNRRKILKSKFDVQPITTVFPKKYLTNQFLANYISLISLKWICSQISFCSKKHFSILLQEQEDWLRFVQKQEMFLFEF